MLCALTWPPLPPRGVASVGVVEVAGGTLGAGVACTEGTADDANEFSLDVVLKAGAAFSAGVNAVGSADTVSAASAAVLTPPFAPLALVPSPEVGFAGEVSVSGAAEDLPSTFVLCDAGVVVVARDFKFADSAFAFLKPAGVAVLSLLSFVLDSARVSAVVVLPLPASSSSFPASLTMAQNFGRLLRIHDEVADAHDRAGAPLTFVDAALLEDLPNAALLVAVEELVELLPLLLRLFASLLLTDPEGADVSIVAVEDVVVDPGGLAAEGDPALATSSAKATSSLSGSTSMGVTSSFR